MHQFHRVSLNVDEKELQDTHKRRREEKNQPWVIHLNALDRRRSITELVDALEQSGVLCCVTTIIQQVTSVLLYFVCVCACVCLFRSVDIDIVCRQQLEEA